MTKIEEIKERVGKIKNAPWKRSEEYSHDYYLQGYSVDAEKGVPNIADCIEEVEDADLIANAPTDIQYLLSKLEAAEKVLELIDGVYVPFSNRETIEVAETMKVMARQALQQIRA